MLNKKHTGLFAVLLLSVMSYFAIAADFESSIVGETTFNTSTEVTINISINNTNSTLNITEVNITIPSVFSIVNDSNGTSANDTNFTNYTYNVAWSNLTSDGFIDNETIRYFWFNISIPEITGDFNLTITVTDTNGTTNSSNETISVNDITLPNVTLNYPGSNWTTGNEITFNCSAQDNIGLKNITLYGNWSSGWHANDTKNISGVINSTNFTVNISDGIFVWNCLAYDNSSSSNWSASNRTLRIDTTPPLINITFPLNGNGFDYAPNISVTMQEANSISTVWTNSSIYNQTTNLSSFNFTNQSNLTEGIYSINISANDTLGNANYSVVYFYYDLTLPENLSLVAPTKSNNSVKYVNWFYVNATFNESYPDECFLELYNGSSINMSMTISGQTCYINVTDQKLGTSAYNYKVYLNDSVGRLISNGTYYITLYNSSFNLTSVAYSPDKAGQYKPIIIRPYVDGVSLDIAEARIVDENNSAGTNQTVLAKITRNMTIYGYQNLSWHAKSYNVSNGTVSNTTTIYIDENKTNEIKVLGYFRKNDSFPDETAFMVFNRSTNSLIRIENQSSEKIIENRNSTFKILTLKYINGTGNSSSYVNDITFPLYNISGSQNSSNPVLVSSAVPSVNYSVYIFANDTTGLNKSLWDNISVDNLAPFIENIERWTLDSTKSEIRWHTNESSNSTVFYGTSAAMGLNDSSSDMILNHSITISGLSSTKYYYVVQSCDLYANCNNSEQKTFGSSGGSTGDSSGSGGGGSSGGGSISGGSNETTQQILKKIIRKEVPFEENESIKALKNETLSIINKTLTVLEYKRSFFKEPKEELEHAEALIYSALLSYNSGDYEKAKALAMEAEKIIAAVKLPRKIMGMSVPVFLMFVLFWIGVAGASFYTYKHRGTVIDKVYKVIHPPKREPSDREKIDRYIAPSMKRPKNTDVTGELNEVKRFIDEKSKEIKD